MTTKIEEREEGKKEHVCENCNGDGIVEITIWNDGIEADVEAYCNDCDGTGIEIY